VFALAVNQEEHTEHGRSRKKNDVPRPRFGHAYNCKLVVSIYVVGFLLTAGVRFKLGSDQSDLIT
jgi:hypothetical protein